MRWRLTLAAILVTTGCMTLPGPAPVPTQLALNRRWVSNADGYIFTVGYFTPEQERSPAWEAARIASADTAQFCDNRRIVQRDVRWYPPIAPGEPRCAAVIYSFACTPRRPEWGSSLEYGRRQALLEGPGGSISPSCGEKNRANLPPERIPPPSETVLPLRTDLCRDMLPDTAINSFVLRENNYVQARTTVAGTYIARGRPYTGDAASFLGQAATAGQRIHFVISARDLPHDRHNIFIDRVLTENGEGYCVTLTARQGNALWRRTIRRDSVPSLNHGLTNRHGHSTSEAYWDTYSDSHLLQHQLALHLGLTLPAGHPD